MALNYVSLVFTEQSAGNDPSAGPVVIAPTSAVVAAGQTVVSAQPVSRQFSGGTVTVSLVACDNAGTTPAAGFWAYQITLPGGQPGLYLINYANGATQHFENLTPVIAQTTYGPAASSGGFTNPMTTLGDIIYENATPAAARLAGNTSSTKNFLTQTGNGSASAAPAWGTIAPADLAPAGSPAPGKYAPLLYGAVWGWPWQFWPDSYLCKQDGRVLGDCSITSGQAVLSSASYGFVSGDVGKYVMLNGGAGAGAAPLIGTITSVSGGNATLSATASVTISGNGACIFGTDDTANLASCESAAGSYALAHDYYAEILFWQIITLAAAPAKSGNGTTIPYFYSQIPLSCPAVNGTSRKLEIAHLGPAKNDHADYWGSTVPNVLPGSIVSMASVGNSPDATYGRASVIGGPTGGAALTGGFANVKPVFRGVSVWCPAFTNLMAADARYCGGLHMDGSAKVFAPPAAGVHPYLSDLPANSTFLNSISRGLGCPMIGNNDDVTIPSFACEGYELGLYLQDHATVGRLLTVYVDVGVLVDAVNGVSNKGNMLTIANWSCEQFNGALLSNGGGGSYLPVDICISTETAGGANPAYDVSDSGGTFYGRFSWAGNGRTSGGPVISGAGNLKIINNNLGPGHWSSPPAVPASGTPQQNTAWRDASIVVHTGAGVTVSAITIDGTSTGLTMAAGSSLTLPVLPGGKNVTLTYAGGTPTWDWWLG